jgi:hypothetical protein
VSTSSAKATFKERLDLGWTVAGAKAEVEATTPRAAHAWKARTHTQKKISNLVRSSLLLTEHTIQVLNVPATMRNLLIILQQ